MFIKTILAPVNVNKVNNKLTCQNFSKSILDIHWNQYKVVIHEIFLCRYDPDILVGYEIQQHSWGYLLERAAFLDVDLCTQISRLPGENASSQFFVSL